MPSRSPTTANGVLFLKRLSFCRPNARTRNGRSNPSHSRDCEQVANKLRLEERIILRHSLSSKALDLTLKPHESRRGAFCWLDLIISFNPLTCPSGGQLGNAEATVAVGALAALAATSVKSKRTVRRAQETVTEGGGGCVGVCAQHLLCFFAFGKVALVNFWSLRMEMGWNPSKGNWVEMQEVFSVTAEPHQRMAEEMATLPKHMQPVDPA